MINQKKNLCFNSLLIAVGVFLFSSCQNNTGTSKANVPVDSVATGIKPRLYLDLPDSMNTPDGLTLDAKGSIYLSCPNFGNDKYPGAIYKIQDKKISLVIKLPVSEHTGHAAPMDLAFGPDGNLYVADNQWKYDKEYKSRLIKVTMRNGQAVKAAVVVEGFRLANGIVWKGDDLYVTDSQWDDAQHPDNSAVFHFTLNDLNKGKIQLKQGLDNPYVLASFVTKTGPNKLDNGVDGIDYDSKGNLYTGIFGDGIIYKITLNQQGKSTNVSPFVAYGKLASVDALIIDRENDDIYVADFKANAIKKIDQKGAITILWQNADTNGENGLLDGPAEILFKGNELIISNFDNPDAKDFVDKKFDRPYTLSSLQVKKQLRN